VVGVLFCGLQDLGVVFARSAADASSRELLAHG
jgi:hypothetical protein